LAAVIWGVDTSVWVGALLTCHPDHGACSRALADAAAQQVRLVASAHTLAEVFSVLSRLPLRPAMRPADAQILVTQGLMPKATIIDITHADELAAIALAVAAGRRSGAVHDALHVVVARRAGAGLMLTLNRKDFVDLWDADHIQVPA
jgi:predicted nucleic acid-binding protein